MNRRTFLAASTSLAALWKAPAFAAGEGEAAKLPDSIAALESMRDGRGRSRGGAARADRKGEAADGGGEDGCPRADARHLAALLHGHPLVGRGAALRMRDPAQRASRSSSAHFSRRIAPASRSRAARSSGNADVRTWQEDESPFALVAGGLKDRGMATGDDRHRRDGEVRLRRRHRRRRPRGRTW